MPYRALSVFGLLSLSSTAFAQTFATDTISGTAGFGTVIDSGPGRFDSGVINSRMADLASDATNQGCEAILWAGTWVRGRSPRLQGETDLGGSITGPSITNGSVEGSSFSASLGTGATVTGSTASGNEVNGFFARVSSACSIWYGSRRIARWSPFPAPSASSAPEPAACWAAT